MIQGASLVESIATHGRGRSVVSGSALVEEWSRQEADVVVADFVHSAVLLPDRCRAPTVLFTHNCEAEIYERHEQRERRAWMKGSGTARHARCSVSSKLRCSAQTQSLRSPQRDAQRFERNYGLQEPWKQSRPALSWSDSSGANRRGSDGLCLQGAWTPPPTSTVLSGCWTKSGPRGARLRNARQ